MLKKFYGKTEVLKCVLLVMPIRLLDRFSVMRY